MIYLIQVPIYGKGMLYKVGYTDSVGTRMTQYTDHNPLTTLVGLREGGRSEEKSLHLLLYSLGLKARYLEEWFLGVPEVLEIFHWSWERIRRHLWRKRLEILYGRDGWESRDTLKFKIFKDLYRICPGTWIDELYFGSRYRESSWPSRVIDRFLLELRDIHDPEIRAWRYLDFTKKMSGNTKIIEKLGQKKNPFLHEVRVISELL